MASQLSPLDWAIVAVYLLAMLALGAVLASRIKAFKDYFLAGGALTTPLLICTLVSTYYGLDVTFGTSESGFYYGLAAWLWYSVPYYIFILIAALVISKRLRRQPFITLSDVLEHHYGKGARFVGSIACFVYSAPILQMAGLTAVLQLLGLPVHFSLIVAIGICAMYTMLGGLWADAVSDTVQFVLMCVSLAVALPLALNWVGGMAFVEQLPSEHLETNAGRSMWLLAAWACGGMTVLVEPAFYQRVFAAKDDKSIHRALLLGIGLWAAYDWAVVMVGMIAAGAVQQGLLPEDLEGREALMATMLHVLPLGMKGLMLGGILSAAMSTIDSYSLLAAGNLVYDIYLPLRRKELSEAAMVRLTRIAVVIVMIAAAAISLLFDRLREAWLFMASVLAAVVLAPMMAALFFKPRRLAGVVGCVAGLAGLIAFYVLLFHFGVEDPDEESHVWRISENIELWQDCAALAALPVSAVGVVIGHLLGRKERA